MSEIKIFVSYSHSDLEPRPGFDESRVGQILADIKYELRCHSERSPYRIVRDVEQLLNVSDIVSNEIQQAIDECDIGLLLLSENYCASDSCKQEFVQLLESGKPLILVEAEKIWGNEIGHLLTAYEKEVAKILSAHFWGVEDQAAVQYGWPMPHRDNPERQKKYYDAVHLVKTGIVSRSKDILMERGTSALNSISDECYSVFLACPTADVKPYADKLEGTLTDCGHSVFRFDPELVLSTNQKLEFILSGVLKRCDVYVQMLGALPGRRISERDSSPLVLLQYEIATSQGKPNHTWRSRDFDISECDSDYASFLNSTGSHLTSFEDFEQYLVKKIEDVLAKKRTGTKREQLRSKQQRKTPLPMVAIDAADTDVELAQKLTRALMDYVYVDTLPFEVDRKIIAESVDVHDAIVIAYGKDAASQKRAKSHFNFIRRHKSDLEKNSFELAVGDAAPETAPPCPRGPDVHIISVDNEVDESAICSFLDRLGIDVVNSNGTS